MQNIKLKSHFRENEYYLGRKSEFKNMDMFIAALKKKSNRNQAFIVSFSPIKTNSGLENYQFDQLKTLNGFLVDYFESYFSRKNFPRNRKVEYCYSNYAFYIYAVIEKSSLNDVLRDIEYRVFDIIKDHDIRLFIQPYFGIVKVDPEVSLFELINRSNVARKVAESNFESVIYYEAKMSGQSSTNKTQIDKMMAGLKNGEFEVYYQPKYHLAQKCFVGAEALVRWNSPELGLVSPIRFINFAENSGIIHDIDMFVLSRVCQDIVDTKKRGRRTMPISVNFSLYEFYAPNFLEDIKKTIEKYGLNPLQIEIEITEETMTANTFLVISILKKLKEMGIKILADDFGVGFSNIYNLKQLPIDIIKIDKSFIDDIAVDFKAKEVVKTIINLSKAMNYQVIAEGASDEKQVDVLKKLKCDMIQGYYYSTPLPRKDFEKFLSANPFEKKGSKK
jgi:EAL domain-containing protein (putative c-di-GMP-specific phosphodiesterase class I)